jgi:hypothetical protein
MPLFSMPGQYASEEDLCFVVMPFDRAFNNVYELVESVTRDYAGCKCVRADQIATPSRITDDIFAYIARSRFLIADLTGQNPNVFYEVGLSHALHKEAILLLQEEADAPFDVRGIRYLTYSPLDLGALRERLAAQVKSCLRTLPPRWRRDLTAGRPDVRFTHVDFPERTTADQPVRITAHASNFGEGARQAYVSLSFPAGVDRVKIIDSDLTSKLGHKGDKWKAGQVILRYPIAEMFTYQAKDQIGWKTNAAYAVTAEVATSRRGLLRFYLSASSQSGDQDFSHDPTEAPFRDQRDIPVYCGVIEVG